MLWMWSSRFDELYYHTLASTQLHELGDAVLFENIRSEIPSNSYVSVSGVLGQKAATLRGLRAGSFRYGRYQVRQLLGSKIFIEYDENLFHEKFNPFTRIHVTGRLTDFGPKSELHNVRDFFKNYYKKPISKSAVLITINEKPRSNFVYVFLFLISGIILILSFYFSLRAFRFKN